jgi:pyrroloquinoline quinone (PQQ) biosynthesis protein C
MKNDIVTPSHKLLQEAIHHQSINHPYLRALENADFPNPVECIKYFAIQYGGYSLWFTKYLAAVMSKLDDQEHRMWFVENLAEESGKLEEEDIELLKIIGIEKDWVEGVPHTELFKRFQESIGSNVNQELSDATVIWRELFHALLLTGSQAEALGAIGLGTECVVKYIFKYVLNAIKNNTSIGREKYVFFELHSEIDDKHGNIIIKITNELIEKKSTAYYDVRKGMLKALDLRCMFWNHMYDQSKRL